MYPYHNKIKQRIKNRELINYEYVDTYKNISPCMVLYFSTEPKARPIREHRFEEYELLFKSLSGEEEQIQE
jgi:hypothetical protein